MELSARERMTRLIEVSAALAKTMTPEQVAAVVVTMGRTALGVHGIGLLRMDDEADDYVLHASSGGVVAPVERVAADSEATIALCARTGQAAAGIGRGSGQEIFLPLLIRGH